MYRLHDALSKLAICHLLIAGALVLALLRLWLPVSLLCLAVGIGGISAAWGLWTEQAGGWLDISAALRQAPSHEVVQTIAEHAPFAVIGIGLLLWRVGW